MEIIDVALTRTSCCEGGARSPQEPGLSVLLQSYQNCVRVSRALGTGQQHGCSGVTSARVGLTARDRRATGWRWRSLHNCCLVAARRCRGKAAFLRRPRPPRPRSADGAARPEPPRGTELLPAREAESHGMQQLPAFAFVVVGTTTATKTSTANLSPERPWLLLKLGDYLAFT